MRGRIQGPLPGRASRVGPVASSLQGSCLGGAPGRGARQSRASRGHPGGGQGPSLGTSDLFSRVGTGGLGRLLRLTLAPVAPPWSTHLRRNLATFDAPRFPIELALVPLVSSARLPVTTNYVLGVCVTPG